MVYIVRPEAKKTHKLYTYVLLLPFIFLSIAVLITYYILGNISVFFPEVISVLIINLIVFFGYRWANHAELIGIKLECYVFQDMYEEAEKLLEKSLNNKLYTFSNDHRKNLYNLRSVLYLKKGQYKDGLKLSNEIVKEFPEFWNGWYLKGLHEFNLGRKEKALQSFDKACHLFRIKYHKGDKIYRFVLRLFTLFKNKNKGYDSERLLKIFRHLLIEEKDFKSPISECDEWNKSDYVWTK